MINSETKVVGVFGYPVAHTLSPDIHNTAFAWANLNYVYLAFEVRPDGLARAINSLKVLKIEGVNLTIPHKEKVLPLLDWISPVAKQVGAVNTIKVKNGGLLGYNTDVEGFSRALKRSRIDAKNRAVLLIGAGGAARSVAVSLIRSGASEITIANRTVSRANALAKLLCKLTNIPINVIPLDRRHLASAVRKGVLLINATSCGLKKSDPMPIPADLLHRKLVVCDLIYNPMKTPLLYRAETLGCKIMNGEAMLVYQAAQAWEIWTNRRPPLDQMFRVLHQALVTRERRGWT